MLFLMVCSLTNISLTHCPLNVFLLCVARKIYSSLCSLFLNRRHEWVRRFSVGISSVDRGLFGFGVEHEKWVSYFLSHTIDDLPRIYPPEVAQLKNHKALFTGGDGGKQTNWVFYIFQFRSTIKVQRKSSRSTKTIKLRSRATEREITYLAKREMQEEKGVSDMIATPERVCDLEV